jgi:hypothetical protein
MYPQKQQQQQPQPPQQQQQQQASKQLPCSGYPRHHPLVQCISDILFWLKLALVYYSCAESNFSRIHAKGGGGIRRSRRRSSCSNTLKEIVWGLSDEASAILYKKC